METDSDLTIEQFEERQGNLSSAWLVGVSPEGAKYTVGFVPHYKLIKIEGERKKAEEGGKYKLNSSGINEVSNEMKKRTGGKIEPFQHSDFMSIDTCSICPEIKLTKDKIVELARYIKNELKFTDVKIKRAHFF